MAALTRWKLEVERWMLKVPLLCYGIVLAPQLTTFADEPQECFQAFALATANYEQGKIREGASTLQALGDKLKSVPWHDIAVTKAAELQESFDRATARKNYDEVISRLKDRATDKLGMALVAVASRGLQRIESEEIVIALKKYYLDKVEYPSSLDTLVQAKYLKDEQIRDASGKTYAYATGVERLIPSVPRQTYTLEKLPVPPFGWKDAKIVGMSAQTAVIQWPNAPSRSLRVGDKADDLEVFSVVDNGVILGNDARLVVLSSK